MEARPTLPIESFSYRWLINLKTSFQSLDDSLQPSDQAAFIVMDPNMTPSKRFLRHPPDFNFPTTKSPLKISKIEPIEDTFHDSHPNYSLHITSNPSKSLISINQVYSSLPKKCLRSTKRVFAKYLCFLKPVYYLRKQSSSKFSCSSISMLQDTNNNCEDSQRMMMSSSSNSIGDFCDYDGPIYEAVLHCKKSIGK